MIGGPGSPSVLVNVVTANEYQGEWIADLLGDMGRAGKTRVEVEIGSQRQWVDKVRATVAGTVLEGAKSWYVGANVPGKAKGFLAYAGGIKNSMQVCQDS